MYLCLLLVGFYSDKYSMHVYVWAPLPVDHSILRYTEMPCVSIDLACRSHVITMTLSYIVLTCQHDSQWIGSMDSPW